MILLLIPADTLRYAVILIFDLLTFNVCIVSTVVWSNFVPFEFE